VISRRLGTLSQFHLQRLGVGTEYTQPLKMELTEGSETSANHNRTPGKYPKEYIQVQLVNNKFIYVYELDGIGRIGR
jgi:hypothetical protein